MAEAAVSGAGSTLPDGVRPGVATGQRVTRLLEYAKSNQFAYPVVDCIGSDFVNHALGAARAAAAPLVLEVTLDGATWFAGESLDREVATVSGAIAFAMHTRLMAVHYGVPVIIQSGSCAKADFNWLDAMIDADEKYYAAYGEPLFSAHTLTFTNESIDEQITVSTRYVLRLKKIMCMLNVELAGVPADTTAADAVGDHDLGDVEISADVDADVAAAIAMSLQPDDSEPPLSAAPAVSEPPTDPADPTDSAVGPAAAALSPTASQPEEVFKVHQALMRASSGAAHGGGSSDGPLGSNEAVGEGGFFFDADLKDMRSPAFLIIPVCLSSEALKNFGTAQTITQLTLGTQDAKPVFIGVNGAVTGSGDAINDALACGVVKVNMGEGALAAYSSGFESASASGGDPRTTLRTAAESWGKYIEKCLVDLKCTGRLGRL